MRELYQIFYKNNKFDTPNKIETLESFFYDMNRLNFQIEPIMKEVVELKEIVELKEVVELKENKKIENKSKNIFEPKQKDSIFWCLFVYIYGYGEYTMVGSKYGNRELEEKQKMISLFKENPKVLKTTNHKITNGNIQEIFSEYLSFQNETTLLGVIGLAVYYNIRILLVDTSKKIYLDYHTNDTTKTCVLYKNTGIRGQTKYTIDMSITDENIQMIQNTMLCLEHYTKALKAISTYTVLELEDIGKKLDILNDDCKKKIKKQELYSQIAEYCGVFLEKSERFTIK